MKKHEKVNDFIENFKLCEFLGVYQPKGNPENEKIKEHFDQL